MGKYRISRTSSCSGRPHPDAIKEVYIHIDRRTVATLEEAKTKHWYEQWYIRGVNHRIERGMIACDVKYIDGKSRLFTRWVIEIDDLREWIEQLGEEVVISPTYSDNATEPLMEIEIYDDCKE